MPLLEDLMIRIEAWDQTLRLNAENGRIPLITLPKLRKLRLGVTLPVAAFFLGNTTAAPGCSMQLDILFPFSFTVRRFEFTPDELATLYAGLLRYTHGYFLGNMANTSSDNQGLSLQLTSRIFHLRDGLPLEARRPISKTIDPEYVEYLDAFVINIEPPTRISPSLFSLLFNVISQCRFPSSIKMIHLNIDITKVYNFNIVDFRHLLLSFASVEEMCTTAAFLQFMLNSRSPEESIGSTRVPAPLPSLHTVQLKPLKYVEEVHTIERFIAWRRNLSMPLTVLDLSASREYLPQNLGKFTVLDHIPGLRIIWDEDDYVRSVGAGWSEEKYAEAPIRFRSPRQRRHSK
ncbi:hypothetical protein BDZ97DRAFT_1864573 [Flammula alnicola]|nr:hypothetical protein BDZ97DRAFT_1864573 [Flammula alnicola]